MRDTEETALNEAESILFIKMLRLRFPYLDFRENKLGVVAWYCIEEPVNGLPDTWMLIYLYRHQETLRRYLSKPYDDRFRAVERKLDIFLNGAPNSALIWAARATAPGPIMTPAEPLAKDGKLGWEEFQRCLQHEQLADLVMYFVAMGTIGGISTT